MKIWIAPHGLHIEPATIKDAKKLAQLHKSAFYRSWSENDFALMLSDATKNPCLIACNKRRKIIGFAILKTVANEAELLSIIIDKKWRKKSIGKALLSAIIDDLTMSAITKLFLEVAEDNISAINLYKSFAFDIIDKREAYYAKKGEKAAAALVMVRNLD